MKFLGIDLHSNRFTCCFLFEDGSKKKLTFDINSYQLNEFYKLLDLNTCVMVEASSNTFKFAELIEDKVNKVYIANPHKLKLISMVKKKTDKIDSEKLAIFLKMQITSGEDLIKPVYHPEQEIQDLRSLFGTYDLLRKQIVMLKNRIHSILKQNLYPFTKKQIFSKTSILNIKKLNMNEVPKFQINFLFDELEHSEKSINKIEEKIKLKGVKYYNEIDILTSMRGISIFTALAIISDIAIITRFPNSKHFTSYLRSAPSVDSTNETVRITKTNKFGRKRSVRLIIQSIIHFRETNPRTKEWYTKNLNHKSKGKIRMAIGRRILTEIFQMLKKKEYHYWRDIKNHKFKMNQYRNFLKKNGILIAEIQKVA